MYHSNLWRPHLVDLIHNTDVNLTFYKCLPVIKVRHVHVCGMLKCSKKWGEGTKCSLLKKFEKTIAPHFKGTHTVCLSSSHHKSKAYDRTHFHCIPTWVARSSR